MITGTELIRALEAEADSQVRTASAIKESTVNDLAHKISGALRFPLSSIQRVDLIRALRTKNILNDRYRAEELPWLPDDAISQVESEFSSFERISTEAHQARTQAAYISGVLRPFDPKFSYRWLNELSGAEQIVAKERIENLERTSIETFDQLMDWALDVVELFKDLVVADEVSNETHSKRSSGSIAFKSSRTYIQAWLAFIKKNAPVLLSQGGPDLDQNIRFESSTPRGSDTYPADEVDEFMDEALVAMKRLQGENLALKQSLDATKANKLNRKSQPHEFLPKSAAEPGVTIWAVSNSGEKASCNFPTSDVAEKGLKLWVEALSALWPEVGLRVSFEISIQLPNGQLQLSLPQLSLEEASKRFTSLIVSMKAMS